VLETQVNSFTLLQVLQRAFAIAIEPFDKLTLALQAAPG
jgi:hypothetical protein